MSIPVTINQEALGTLTISRDGLYTVLEAAAPPVGGLVRLWAHGGGRSAYLGLMQPTDEGLLLRRRLSRRELAAFPDPIESVSDREDEQDTESQHKVVDIKEKPTEETLTESGDKSESSGEAENSNSKHKEVDINKEPPKAEPEETGAESKEETAPSAEAEDIESLHKTETDYSACPWPAEPPEEGLLWYSRGTGR